MNYKFEEVNSILFNLNYVNEYTQNVSLPKGFKQMTHCRFIGTPSVIKCNWISKSYIFNNDESYSPENYAIVSNEIGVWEKINSSGDISNLSISLKNPISQTTPVHICVQFINYNSTIDFSVNDFVYIQFTKNTKDISLSIPSQPILNYKTMRMLTDNEKTRVRTNFTEKIYYYDTSNIGYFSQQIVIGGEYTWYKVVEKNIIRLDFTLISNIIEDETIGIFIEFSKFDLPTKMFRSSVINSNKLLIKIEDISNNEKFINNLVTLFNKKDAIFDYFNHDIYVISGVGISFFDELKNWYSIGKTQLILQLTDKSSTQYDKYEPGLTNTDILYIPFSFFPNDGQFIYNTDAKPTLASNLITYRIYSVGNVIISYINETDSALTSSNGNSVQFLVKYKDDSMSLISKKIENGEPLFDNFENINEINIVNPNIMDGFNIVLTTTNWKDDISISTSKDRYGSQLKLFKIDAVPNKQYYFLNNITSLNVLSTAITNPFSIDSLNLNITENTVDNMYALSNPICGNDIIPITTENIDNILQTDQGKIYIGNNTLPTLFDKKEDNPILDSIKESVALSNYGNNQSNPISSDFDLSWILMNYYQSFKDDSVQNIEVEYGQNNVASIKTFVEQNISSSKCFFIKENGKLFEKGIRIIKNSVDMRRYWNLSIFPKIKIELSDFQFDQANFENLEWNGVTSKWYFSKLFNLTSIITKIGTQYKNLSLYTNSRIPNFLSCDLSIKKRGIYPIYFAKTMYKNMPIQNILEDITTLNSFRILSDRINYQTYNLNLEKIIIILE